MPDAFNPSVIMRSRRTDFRTRSEGEDLIVEGYFVVFDQPYYLDAYSEEIIERSAFEGCDMTDVRALVDHLSHLVLGRNTVNTLTLSLDDTGLYAVIRINRRDTDALNLHARVQRGDVDQASFGFDEDETRTTYVTLPDGRVQVRIGGILKLWEVSVCTFPAYEQTSVSARSRAADEQRQKQINAARKEKLKRRFRHHD